MSQEELNKSLESLRSELDALAAGDELVKERVSRLLSDLEHQVQHPDDAAHQAGLVESVRTLTEQFEVEHPRITGIANHIMVTLSNMGI